MSENLDLVRSMFAAWERGDFTSTEWAHPDIEYIADGPSAGSSTGLAAFVERGREDLRSWENFRVQAEDYRQLDDERVLVLVTFSGHGKASGLDLEQMRT
jgi:ketosteroid isomerase-like protein